MTNTHTDATRILATLDRYQGLSAHEIGRKIGEAPEIIANHLNALTGLGLVVAQSHWNGSPEPAYTITEHGMSFA